MQLQLPIFSTEAKKISDVVGYYTKDGIIQYIVNGLPVYAHGEDDLSSFRFFSSMMISQGLVKKIEVHRSFNVSEDSVTRYFKKFEEEGADGFFGKETKRKSSASKIVGKKIETIQKKLDKNQSVLSIAREEGVSEGSIRYQIGQGVLKKSKVGEGTSRRKYDKSRAK
jgi:predicted transcriptional regulator